MVWVHAEALCTGAAKIVDTSKAGEWVSDDDSEGCTRELRVGGGQAVAYTRQSPGKVSGNEDSIGIFPYGPGGAVLAVADGAGGLPAGQKASRTAIATLRESLQRAGEETQLLRTAILNAIEKANQDIIALANGSATTLTVVTVEGRLARCYHVGDSIALITGQRGALRFQTVAHSPVGFAVEAGFLSEREAMFHMDRHIVSNFMGNNAMRIDVSPEITLAARDTIVVSSDGLSDNLQVDEIVERARCGPASQALRKMIELADFRMRTTNNMQPSKPDDLSVVVYRKVPKPG